MLFNMGLVLTAHIGLMLTALLVAFSAIFCLLWVLLSTEPPPRGWLVVFSVLHVIPMVLSSECWCAGFLGTLFGAALFSETESFHNVVGCLAFVTLFLWLQNMRSLARYCRPAPTFNQQFDRLVQPINLPPMGGSPMY